MCAKPGFMLYCEWEPTLSALSADSLQELLRAMFLYTRTGEELSFRHGDAALVWTMLRPRLDYDTRRYETVSRQRRDAVNKRWDKVRAESAPAQPAAPAKSPAPAAPAPAPAASEPFPMPPGGFPPVKSVPRQMPRDYSPAVMDKYLNW